MTHTPMTPWSRGRPLSWDVPVLKMTNESHLPNSGKRSRDTVNTASGNRMIIFVHLVNTLFYLSGNPRDLKISCYPVRPRVWTPTSRNQ